jgi:hypothetical protein
MRNFALALAVVLMSPITILSQGLYFTVIDSLNYNPRSLTVADFNGDSLDELFVGTDTGLVVVDPRTHVPLWHSSMLREAVTASAFFDINGDGSREILLGTDNNGYWLNIIYGPLYTNWYRWGGYINGTITDIMTGIWPDTANIIVAAGGLYSINTTTWDYLYGIHHSSRAGKAVNLISENQIIYSEVPPWGVPEYTFYIGNLVLSSSELEIVLTMGICNGEFNHHNDQNYPIALYEIAPGIFINNTNHGFVAAGYSLQDTLMRLICFNQNHDIVFDYSYFDYMPLANTALFWLVATDLNNDGLDEIITLTRYPTEVSANLHSGANLQKIGNADFSANNFALPGTGKIVTDSTKELVYKADNRIYVSEISIEPNGIRESGNADRQIPAIDIYPNPFNNTAKIIFTSERSEHITIESFNMLGQRVEQIYNGFANAGIHTFRWENHDLTSGSYFIIVRSDSFKASTKAVYLK